MSEDGIQNRQTAEVDENELVRVRRAKLERILGSGREAYRSSYHEPGKLNYASELGKRYSELENGAGSGDHAVVAGRMMARRGHGKATFIDLMDSSGKIQLLMKQDLLGEEQYGLLDELDVGDWIGAAGEVLRSRRGELSVAAESFELLSKSLRPLPEKWHGLRDPEARHRQRYLDLIMNEEARKALEARSTIISEIRRILDGRGYLEVETPMLQQMPGGAAARPFVTHHNALDIDLYLRIAPELYLKRLLVGGYDKVYELNRNFRNEGISTRHNPEFTMLEAYTAFVDYRYLMDLVEELVSKAIIAVNGTTEVDYGDHKLSFAPPWKRITMIDAIKEYGGLTVSLDMGSPELLSIAAAHGIELPKETGPGTAVTAIFEKLVEPVLVQPTFVLDYPTETSPLARRRSDAPEFTERFEVLVAGQEIANAFSELVDPVDQRARFEAQAKMREAGDDEAHPVDEEYLVAMEYGMPPAGGLGIGIDRLAMLATGCQNIREVIMFPHLRPLPEQGRRKDEDVL